MGQSKSKSRPSQTLLQQQQQQQPPPQRSQSFPNNSQNNLTTLTRSPPPARSSQLTSRHYPNVDHGTLSFQPINVGTFATVRTMAQSKFFCTSQQSPGFANGYAFTSQQIKPGESFVMKIVQTAPSPPTSYPLTSPSMVCNIGRLGLGFTSCDPKFLRNKDLPSRDPNDLLDRPEYWILNGSAAVGCVPGDEFCVTFEIGGRIVIAKNGSVGTTVVYVDNSAPLWPFFILFGSLIEISLLGKTRTDSATVGHEQARLFASTPSVDSNTIFAATTAAAASDLSDALSSQRDWWDMTTPVPRPRPRLPRTTTIPPARPPPPAAATISNNFVVRNIRDGGLSSSIGAAVAEVVRNLSLPPIEHHGESAVGRRRGRRGRRNRRQNRDMAATAGEDNDIEFAADVVAHNNFYDDFQEIQENNQRGRRGRGSSSRGNRRSGHNNQSGGGSRQGNSDVVSPPETTREIGEVGSSRQMREGDWTCPDHECRSHNFAFRTHCFRCCREKPVPVENTRGGGSRGRGRGRGHLRGRGGRGRDRNSHGHAPPPPPPPPPSVPPISSSVAMTTTIFAVSSSSESQPGGGANNEKDGGDCIICCDQSVDTVFLPCGHVSLCVVCAQNYWRQQLLEGSRNCPICRGISTGFIKIYKS